MIEMSATYNRMTCPYCKQEISTSGGGVHHYRKHVREGILIEYEDTRRIYGRVKFIRATAEEIESAEKIGWVRK